MTSKPAGLRPVFVLGFLAGVGLILWAVYAPSINMMWQIPLGMLLTVSTMGKMVAR
jgi:hypothetical protein